MKTLITASALILATSLVQAESWEDAWQNHDLNTGVYDKPVTLVEPSGVGDFRVSLYDWVRGSSDGYQGEIEGYVRSPLDSVDTISSLDVFNRGNHDHDHANPLWDGPVLGLEDRGAVAATY